MKKVILVLFCLFLFACEDSTNLVNDFPPKADNGLLNVVIEIPAGTSEKWEVHKPEGELVLEHKKGKPRIIQYLPYPINYGMVPRTILPKELGGDGDPLDAVVIGSAIERGTIAEVKVLGILKLLDRGEQDDKIITVARHSPLYHVNSLEELDTEYPGVSDIIQTWFHRYKGKGKMEVLGFGGLEDANTVINQAIDSY